MESWLPFTSLFTAPSTSSLLIQKRTSHNIRLTRWASSLEGQFLYQAKRREANYLIRSMTHDIFIYTVLLLKVLKSPIDDFPIDFILSDAMRTNFHW